MCSKLGVVRLCVECTGFVGLATKPTQLDFSVWALKLSLKARCDGDGIRVHQEVLRRRVRGVIVELASEGSKSTVDACPFDGDIDDLPILPLRGCVSSFML